MADSPPGGGEKTEAATEKRRRDAAKKGDVLQSKELGGALVMGAGLLVLTLSGGPLVEALSRLMAAGLSFGAADVADFDPMGQAVRLLAPTVGALGVLFGATTLAAVAGPALLGSLGFRIAAAKPKWSKLNPGAGLKRIFGVQGLMELAKSLAKVVLLGAFGGWVLFDRLPGFLLPGLQPVERSAAAFGSLFGATMLAVVIGFFLIAAIDVPMQAFQRNRKMKMTKQEVKDELKETDGSPETKAARRQRQYALLSGSARRAVEEATVVLTNPTHFAVVLRYRPGEDAAPAMLAKGADATAAAIRALAEDKGVTLLEYPELARAIYFTTRAGELVDERLYVAVATILAFVFRLDAEMAARADRPRVSLPEELRFDATGGLARRR